MRTLRATIEIEYPAPKGNYKTDNPAKEDLEAYENDSIGVLEAILNVGEIKELTIREVKK